MSDLVKRRLGGDLPDHVAHGERHHLEDDRVADRHQCSRHVTATVAAHERDDALHRGQADSLGARKITTQPTLDESAAAALPPFTAISMRPDEPTTARSSPGATLP